MPPRIDIAGRPAAPSAAASRHCLTATLSRSFRTVDTNFDLDTGDHFDSAPAACLLIVSEAPRQGSLAARVGAAAADRLMRSLLRDPRLRQLSHGSDANPLREALTDAIGLGLNAALGYLEGEAERLSLLAALVIDDRVLITTSGGVDAALWRSGAGGEPTVEAITDNGRSTARQRGLSSPPPVHSRSLTLGVGDVVAFAPAATLATTSLAPGKHETAAAFADRLIACTAADGETALVVVRLTDESDPIEEAVAEATSAPEAKRTDSAASHRDPQTPLMETA